MSDAEIMDLYSKNPNDGISKMVEKYSDYIYFIINKHYPSFRKETSDMYQNGVIGLINAMCNYNADVSAFSTFATPFIKKELSRHVQFMNGDSSEYFASIHNSVEKAKTEIELAGNSITVERVMEKTGLSRKIVNRELKVDRTKVSYDALESHSVKMQLPDAFVVNDMLSCIPVRYRQIIAMKVLEDMPFSKIAKELNISITNVKHDYEEGINLLREAVV